MFSYREPNMNRHKHIIWDWNGTLIDDAWLCVEILNVLLKDRNMPAIDLKRYQSAFRFPVLDFYKDLHFDFSKESFDDISVEYISLYNRRRFECDLFADALNILEAIQKQNIRQYILSAYNQAFLEEAVGHYCITDYFSKLIGLDNIHAASKLQNGIRWMKESGYKADEILFVGDSDHDLEVANGMGVSCVLMDYGHQNRERLLSLGVPIFSTLRELREFLKL